MEILGVSNRAVSGLLRDKDRLCSQWTRQAEVVNCLKGSIARNRDCSKAN